MARSGGATGDPPASPGAAEGQGSPRVVGRIEALLESGRRKQAIKGPSLLESAGEMLRNQMRSPILRHAIAALRRGNNDAAFALLREAVDEEPDQPESTQLLWE